MQWSTFALLAVSVNGLFAQSTFYLRDGDRVVFYGDSITDQRLYTVFTETYAVTRFPTENFTFIHSGWGGDRVTGGGGGPIDLRLRRDLLAYKPTVVTIMLGMNDAAYKPFDAALLTQYEKGYEHILDVIQGSLPGVRVTVIQPSPFDDVTQPLTFAGGYNAVLLRYAKYVKELAASVHADTADLNDPVVADLQKANATDPAGAKKLIPDRVHPGPAGHLLMAEALLKAWNAPAIVSEVDMNVKTRRADNAVNANVSDVGPLSWTVLEKSLPMPIDWNDPSTVLAINSSDFLEALDQEVLRVSGLNPGKWSLQIDGTPVATFTAEDLAKGINLVRYATPMMKQAAKVQEYTKKHTDVHNTRWRTIQVPLGPDNLSGLSDALKALDNLELDLVTKQHEAAQPVAHKFELVPQS